jgi:hypothetical protein
MERRTCSVSETLTLLGASTIPPERPYRCLEKFCLADTQAAEVSIKVAIIISATRDFIVFPLVLACFTLFTSEYFYRMQRRNLAR